MVFHLRWKILHLLDHTSEECLYIEDCKQRYLLPFSFSSMTGKIIILHADDEQNQNLVSDFQGQPSSLTVYKVSFALHDIENLA